MSDHMLRSIILSRFDADYSSPDSLLKMHSNYYGDNSVYFAAKEYFKKRLDFHTAEIIKGTHVFCPHLFHTLIGCLITGQKIDETKVEKISKFVFSLKHNGGFLTIDKKYLDQFPKLKAAEVSPLVPEIYSSYYSFLLLKLLGANFDKQELEALLAWIIVHQKSSGAIYNNTYSNTDENRRFETEISCQTYFGASLISIISAELPEFETIDTLINAKNWALEKWLSLRTVAARYFALKTIQLVSPNEIGNVGFREGLGFLDDRADAQGDGFYDYRLADKIDEEMTSSCATGLDKISPHIFSTYYAASIMRIFWLNGVSVNIPNEQIRRLPKRQQMRTRGSV